ncbi:unnamed protein product [Phytophthora lilii]|uniref:Unnamed protein product n=1 Tax=Phytophthora lilii TaxID=2077276 RepID=A0A9W6TGT7_9STRA|nr:unnamed protein product [Phytophthora lilii]
MARSNFTQVWKVVPQFNRRLALWEALQVELHGAYSKSRLLSLANYASKTTLTHAIVVMILIPLPCLAVTIVVNVLPLANPFDGLKANKLFLLRQCITVFVYTTVIIFRFCRNVPDLKQPIWRIMVKSVVVAVISAVVLYAMSQIIGFPLPFSTLIISGVVHIDSNICDGKTCKTNHLQLRYSPNGCGCS